MILLQQRNVAFSMWSQKQRQDWYLAWIDPPEDGVFPMWWPLAEAGWWVLSLSQDIRRVSRKEWKEKTLRMTASPRVSPYFTPQMQGGFRWRHRYETGVLKSPQYSVEVWRQECSTCVNGTKNLCISVLGYGGADWRRTAPNRGCNLKLRGSLVWPWAWSLFSYEHPGYRAPQSVLICPLSLHHTAYTYVYICFILSTQILTFMSVFISDTTVGRIFFWMSIALR